MKKFLLAVFLMSMFSSVSFGAVSQDMNVYVRQDVFDAKMEALFERLHGEIILLRSDIKSEISALSGRMDKQIAEVRNEIAALKGEIAAVKSEVKAVSSELHTFETVVYWGMGLLTLLLSAVAISPVLINLLNYLRTARKPSLTIEDVRQIVEEMQMTVRPPL